MAGEFARTFTPDAYRRGLPTGVRLVTECVLDSDLKKQKEAGKKNPPS
jgi:hypothetical protein